MQQRLELVKIFNAKGATGTTTAFPIADWQHVFLSLFTSGSANFTMNIKVSHSITAPDFTAAATPSNQWSYAQIKPTTTNTAVDGWASMITTAGTDIIMNYTLNLDGARWIAATITVYAAWAITLGVSAKNNQ